MSSPFSRFAAAMRELAEALEGATACLNALDAINGPEGFERSLRELIAECESNSERGAERARAGTAKAMQELAELRKQTAELVAKIQRDRNPAVRALVAPPRKTRGVAQAVAVIGKQRPGGG